MNIIDIITKKKNKEELTEEEIKYATKEELQAAIAEMKAMYEAIVEKMGKDGVATLATMNLSPALFGAVLEILNA